MEVASFATFARTGSPKRPTSSICNDSLSSRSALALTSSRVAAYVSAFSCASFLARRTKDCNSSTASYRSNMFRCLRRVINECSGCPIHPTRVDSSLVFAIRLTGSRFARDLKMLSIRFDSIRSNRHESFPLLSIRYTGSRFARVLENIASRVYTGWVENVVDSTRFDRTETIRVISCRVIIAEVNSREPKQIWAIWTVMS